MVNRDTRRQTRECAMQLLYEMEVQKDFSEAMRASFLQRLKQLRDYEGSDSENEAACPIEIKYFNRLLETVEANRSEIDQLLASAAENWRIDRIAKVDLAVLRLSVAEIQYLDNIPNSVSINEAVELAKKFGSEDSGKFVNGVLGRIAKGKNS
jgi:N utilization substance protein B